MNVCMHVCMCIYIYTHIIDPSGHSEKSLCFMDSGGSSGVLTDIWHLEGDFPGQSQALSV